MIDRVFRKKRAMNILSTAVSLVMVLVVLAVASTAETNQELPNSSHRRKAQQENTQPISFYGLNYNTRKGPDWAADMERCKSRAEVVRDLKLLSRITTRIRLLSLVDCDQGALVWSVLTTELSSVNMETWLGLWVGPDPQVFGNEVNALAKMIPDIMASENWKSRLSGITVGSEAIYREDLTISEAIANLETTRALLQAYRIKMDVPVAIVDIAPIYSNSQELRIASDTIMTNTFPFWEGLPVDLAVDELEIDLGWLVNLPESQGKPFILSEHGWPSAGNLDNVGIASPQNQQQYTRESYCYLKQKGWAYYWFTAIDNDWRQDQDPDNTIEGNWGFLDDNLKLKDHFEGFEFSCGDGSTYSFGAVDWSVPELQQDDSTSANASCGLWQGCEALAGNCCPNAGGDFLGCCRAENFLGPADPNSAPIQSPTKSPTQSPTNSPTQSPTKSPTQSPSKFPTESPTKSPTQSPTKSPVPPDPTDPSCSFCRDQGLIFYNNPIINFSTGSQPVSCGNLSQLVRSGLPTDFCETERSIIESTCCSTRRPTPAPTILNTTPLTTPPTPLPTNVATPNPTKVPTAAPTNSPTSSPTTPQTVSLTSSPTKVPTAAPTKSPTAAPTFPLTTSDPTASPITLITTDPTMPPTISPTASPTKLPTTAPTASPTKLPTTDPTASPTKLPTTDPTASPTESVAEETASDEGSGIFPPESETNDEVIKDVFPWDATGGALPPDSLFASEGSSHRHACMWKRAIAISAMIGSVFLL